MLAILEGVERLILVLISVSVLFFGIAAVESMFNRTAIILGALREPFRQFAVWLGWDASSAGVTYLIDMYVVGLCLGLIMCALIRFVRKQLSWY